jgi:hypothetical protein
VRSEGKRGVPDRATLIISRADLPESSLDRTLRQLPEEVIVQLFFVDEGVHLVGDNLLGRAVESAVYCSQGHRQLNGPEPLKGVRAGGLLDLGEMIRGSRYVFSVPHTLSPARRIESKLKKIGLLLDRDINRAVEGLRVGTGLAGCDHQVTLFPHQSGPSFDGRGAKIPPAAIPYLETLTALEARISTTPFDNENSKYDILISL